MYIRKDKKLIDYYIQAAMDRYPELDLDISIAEIDNLTTNMTEERNYEVLWGKKSYDPKVRIIICTKDLTPHQIYLQETSHICTCIATYRMKTGALGTSFTNIEQVAQVVASEAMHISVNITSCMMDNLSKLGIALV